MRKIIGCLVALAINVSIVSAADLKDLEGEYKVVSFSVGGKKLDFVTKSWQGVTIKGDMFTIKVDSGKNVIERSSTIKLDATKTPAQIDLANTDGPDKGRSKPGIYSYENGKLTIVNSETGRPADIKGTGKSDEVLVLEKKKQK